MPPRRPRESACRHIDSARFETNAYMPPRHGRVGDTYQVWPKPERRACRCGPESKYELIVHTVATRSAPTKRQIAVSVELYCVTGFSAVILTPVDA